MATSKLTALKNLSTAQRLGLLALLATLTSLILYYFVSTTPDPCGNHPESCRDIHINLRQDHDEVPLLVFLRHGIRLDKVPNANIVWLDREERYYDTPLSEYDLPVETAKHILADNRLSHFKPHKIVVSPYRRCIETAAIAGNELGVYTFEIDSRIGEVSHDPTTGNSLLPDNAHYVKFEEMKQLIYKHCTVEQDQIVVEWKHQEKPGNNQWKEALMEYKALLSTQQDIPQHVMFVAHAGILMNLGHSSCCPKLNDMKMKYCAWYAINPVDDNLIASGNLGQEVV